jgi:transcriptional regulator with XRE-family HTH domain
MKISNDISDRAAIEEIGRRLARRRIDMNLTQARLAEQAGVGKRTVERLESGESAQLTSVLRILRVLQLLPGIEALLPEPGIRPMELIERRGKSRRRAAGKKTAPTSKWEWKEPT